MKLADRIRARAATRRAADPVTMEEFGYLLGQGRGNSFKTKAGTTVGPRRALGITAWYSGVRFIAEGIAALPVHTYQDDPAGRIRRSDPSWLAKPDTEQTWFGLVEFCMMSLLHKGNSCSFKLRNQVGQVVGLREMHPDLTTIGQAPDGSKRFRYADIDRDFTVRDVLHIPGLAYDGRVGMNPIQVLAEPLGTVAATNDYAARFFSNGTHVGGVISVQEMMTSDEALELKQEWDRFHQGLLAAHQTGVLSKGAVYNRVSLNAEETQLLESRQFGIAEVARMLRLPPHKLYDLTRATFSNIEHQSIEAVTDGLQPWCERLEAWINDDPDLMPAPVSVQGKRSFIEFQLEGRLRGDTQTRYAAYTSAVGRPWRTPNEVRRLENLPPMDGGDELLMPLNMTNPGGDPATSGQAT